MLTIALKFLENKLSQYSLIAATDLLRVSEFMRTEKELYLQDATFSDTCLTLAQQINYVLELALYALCSVLINQHSAYLKLPLGICRYLF